MTTFLLDYYGFIKIHGPDAKTFLQGQLTCDVNEISENRSHLSARCTPQGRVVSVFRLFQYHDGLFLRLPQSMIPLMMASLKKYAIFSKLTIEDASQQFAALGLQNPTMDHLPQQIDDAVTLPHGALTKVPGDNRYEYYLDHAALKDFLQTNPPSSNEQWHLKNIEASIPEIYPETTEQFTAHDLNLPAFNAVSFSKGCYSGQEIIARTHYRATLKQHLYHTTLTSTKSLIYGAPIQHETNTVGYLIDFAKQDDHAVLLILLRDDSLDKKLVIYGDALKSVYT